MSPQLRQQVIAKIQWGANDQDVLDWLRERHYIDGEAAEVLLAEAHVARRSTVRRRATLMLVASGLGILVTVAAWNNESGLISTLFPGRWGVVAVFITCAALLVRSLYRIWSGEKPGSVD